MAGVPIEVTNMVTEMQDEIASLTAELARKDVELEAWRSGRLHTCLVDNGNMAVDAIKIVDCGHTSFFDTIDAAVDALMAEDAGEGE